MEQNSTGDDWFLLFRQGDRTAFRQVFDRFYRPISYFAQKILKDDSFYEDIVSETFRKAWDRRESFNTPRHLENFLYLVTRNGCISQLRSARVQQSTSQEWVRLADALEDGDAPIDLERVQAKLIELLYEKLQTLPGGDVLRMSFLEGKSTEEIARSLNTSANAVYIIKSRSLKALRAMLTKDEWMLFVIFFLLP